MVSGVPRSKASREAATTAPHTTRGSSHQALERMALGIERSLTGPIGEEADMGG